MNTNPSDTTTHFLSICKYHGIDEVRIVANEGCSQDKSYDIYFDPKYFFVIRMIAVHVDAQLGEYQNMEEGCITVLGQDFDKGKWKLTWNKEEIVWQEPKEKNS